MVNNNIASNSFQSTYISPKINETTIDMDPVPCLADQKKSQSLLCALLKKNSFAPNRTTKDVRFNLFTEIKQPNDLKHPSFLTLKNFLTSLLNKYPETFGFILKISSGINF